VIHLDMNKVTVEKGADLLHDFIENNGIEILNVAGSRASKDPDICTKTSQVLERCIMKSED
jgi:phosphopantetheine adenylyltransferase